MFTYSGNLKWMISFFIYLSLPILADNYNYNSYNNHGVIGLVNMPSARLFNESSYGITIYDGTPDKKITMTSSPYDWLEASFFYTNIQGVPYCSQPFDKVCQQDVKDKGFNIKLRIKEEGALPAIAIGVNDIAGTGLYSSEYIVASYGLNKADFHFGIGWGNLNGSKRSFKNPLSYISDKFNNRPFDIQNNGGQFQPGRYFSGKTASPFFGLSYAFSNKILLKIEHDATLTTSYIPYENPKEEFSFGIEYAVADNFSIGFASERGNYNSIKFIYKNNPKESKRAYKYEPAETKNEWDKYTKLKANLENNGIGVNKIIEGSKYIGLELTQFAHPNLNIIEEIIASAKLDSGITKEIKKDIRIADLKAISEFDSELLKSSNIIYERKRESNFNTDTKLAIRPFLASREEFFKGALMLENNSEYIIKDNFFFTSNLKYSIADNFDDLIYPPVDTYPAQVRSDIKEYLRNFDRGIIIGRAQFDYHITPKKNNHIMLTMGVLEDMFSGYGFEYLFFKEDTNYAYGFEAFNVIKRDYKMKFGTLDYRNTVGSVNFYYRNYNFVPFDAKFSYGEYLAGDKGFTFELSRSFLNGVKFGVFASFTDVSAEQFGEGSFDKGIYFNIPIAGSLINYSWRPLTKDPGAKLNRKQTLHDLLVKFRPYND